MVDMGHKLTNYILAQDKKNKKDKNKKKNRDAKKGKDDSDEDKEKKKKEKKEKKAKKEKKSKKDKKESSENGGEENDDYLKAIFKSKKEDDFGSNSDEDEVASEAGVDDDGAMGKIFDDKYCWGKMNFGLLFGIGCSRCAFVSPRLYPISSCC